MYIILIISLQFCRDMDIQFVLMFTWSHDNIICIWFSINNISVIANILKRFTKNGILIKDVYYESVYLYCHRF